jgi:anaerobic ribonucleoside-triphosphate reductase
MNQKNKNCNCCGFPTLPADSLFEICPICGWQDDSVQNDDPDYAGGANTQSLNEYQTQWFTDHKRAKKKQAVA